MKLHGEASIPLLIHCHATKSVSSREPAPGIVVLTAETAPALARDLEAALGGLWPVTVRPADAVAVAGLAAAAAAVVLVERPAGGRAGELLAELGRREPGLPVVIAAGEAAPDELARLLDAGAADFVVHPFRPCDLQARLLRLLGGRPPDPLVGRLKAKLGLRRLVGRSEAFTRAVERIEPLAACDANVLITGETGTGKEVFARAIHHLGRRADRPFVPVNCGAIPTELVENELFGHAAEAFTGAAQARRGLIREAEGGTLFLDEIDALHTAAQVKLLRFLQEKEYRALGSTEARRADLRLIAATNADVDAEVERGRLRRDLYYRLNVLPLALPPLRQRAEDVLLLAQHFLARHAAELERPRPALVPAARQALLEHDWPGNVRELEHVMERALLLAGPAARIERSAILLPARPGGERPPASFKQAKSEAVARFERRYLERLLLAWEGNISRAARAAGKNRRAFFELIRRHGIDARRFREATPSAAPAPAGRPGVIL